MQCGAGPPPHLSESLALPVLASFTNSSTSAMSNEPSLFLSKCWSSTWEEEEEVRGQRLSHQSWRTIDRHRTAWSPGVRIVGCLWVGMLLI